MKDPAFKIAFRNLVRQKRRNLLLGGAIAFGMTIMIVVSSFSNGLSDSLLNRLLVNMAGHIQVTMMEKKDQKTLSVIRDEERIRTLIQKALPPKTEIKERVSTFCSVLGNGLSDNMMLSGVDKANADFEDYLHISAGDFANFTNGSEAYPVILYKEKADILKVKPGDTVRIRMHTLYGQVQSATLRVVAIAGSGNPFADMTGFVPMSVMKELMDYAPWETQSFSITLHKLHKSALAIVWANKVRQALHPRKLLVKGQAGFGGKTQTVVLVGVRNVTNASFTQKTGIQVQTFASNKGVVVSEKVARNLHVHRGDELYLSYSLKNGGKWTQNLKISFVSKETKQSVVWLPAFRLLDWTSQHIPAEIVSNQMTPDVSDVLADEWELLLRSTTSKDYREKLKKLKDRKWNGAVLDVTSMYEIADQIIQMQAVIKMVSFYAVLVLFLIILIGVANSMRMTVRERTWEIGTMRAIGMQSKSVRNVFFYEALLLAFFAALAGGIFGFGLDFLLSLPNLEVKTMMAIFLKDGHLVFLPSFGDFLSGIFIILVLTGIIAYFPARRAARMQVSESLRHTE